MEPKAGRGSTDLTSRTPESRNVRGHGIDNSLNRGVGFKAGRIRSRARMRVSLTMIRSRSHNMIHRPVIKTTRQHIASAMGT